MSNVKLVLVIRRDFEHSLRRGKEIAQGGHAGEYFLTKKLHDACLKAVDRNAGYEEFSLGLSPEMQKWIVTGHKKVVCQIPTEAEMLDLMKEAQARGIEVNLVTDSGLTEFGGPTNTILALGPDLEDRLNPLTGHLKLY